MQIGILTSVDTRHRYFANRLRAALPVVAVAYEHTGYTPAEVDDAGLSPAELQIVTSHFEERARQEERFFGDDSEFASDSDGCAAMRIEPGLLNTEVTLAFLESAGVDVVVVYGTNLIKSPLLDRFAGRMINMHLGLSPYYRGTATNFYPLLNDEPEYVGATVHLLDAGVDSGAILQHARPSISADDRPHTIGCKAIDAGIEATLSALQDFASGRIDPVPQWKVPNSRLYLRKDYHPSQVVELYRKLDEGLIERYLQRADKVRNTLRLVTPHIS